MGNEASSFSSEASNTGGLSRAYTAAKPDAGNTLKLSQQQQMCCQDSVLWELLHKASASNDVTMIQKLIVDRRADVDYVDDRGNTALHKAAWNGKLNAVRLLVRHGANLNRVNSTGYTALEYAKRMGHADVADYLCDMMDRPRPAAVKAKFRAMSRTSNCSRVYGPRDSMKMTAWLIPGQPEVAQIGHDEIALDNANAAHHAKGRSTSSSNIESLVISPATPHATRTTSAALPQAPRQETCSPQRTSSSPASLFLQGHQAAPLLVCSVSSSYSDEIVDSTLAEEPQSPQPAHQARPTLPWLDLSALATTNDAAQDDMLSGRSTSRQEVMAEITSTGKVATDCEKAHPEHGAGAGENACSVARV